MNLNTEKWRKFKIGDLFDGENGDFDIKKEHISNKGFFVITSGLDNYGILGETDIEAKTIREGTLTVDMFGNVFYRPYKYKMVTHARVFALIPKFDMSEKVGLFISSVLFFLKDKFSYSHMCSFNKIKNKEIFLPAKLYNDSPKYHPDWEFMEEYIKYIENKHIERVDKLHMEEIDKALKVAGLAEKDLDGDLTVEPAGMYCEFKIEELFDVLSSKKIFHATELDIYGIDVYRKNKTGLNPYVVRSELNNGVRGYISESSSFLNDENTISFAQDTFVAYYQKKPYFTGNKIKVLEPLFNPKERILLYIETAINKSIASNTWDTGSTVNYIENIKLTLPAIDEKTPDFEYMEKAIYIYIYMASY